MAPVEKEDVKGLWEEEAYGERYGADRIDCATRSEPQVPNFADFESAAGKHVLEIGVGTGADFLSWVRAGALATGVDHTVYS